MKRQSPLYPSTSFASSRRFETALALAVAAFAVGSASAQTTYNWNSIVTPGKWSVDTNWTPTAPTGGPDLAGDIAIINTNIAAASTINLFDTGDAGDSIKTVGRLDFGDTNSTHAFIIATGTGAGILNFDNGGAGAQLNRLATGQAGDTITAPVTLSDNLSINNQANVATTIIGVGGLTAATAGTKTLTNAGTGTGTVTISGIIGNGAGTVAVAQNSATSALTLSGVNTYTGGTALTAGQLNVSNSSAAGGVTGLITASGGTTLNVTNSTTFFGTNVTVSGAGANLTLTSNNATGAINSLFTGSADQTITVSGAGGAQVNLGSNTAQFANFLGTVTAAVGGTLRFSSSTLANGGVNTTFNVLGGMTARNTGTISLGALTGNGSISGSSGGDGTTTYSIGAKGIDSTFSGTIVDAIDATRRAAVTKTGAGTLTLSGANTYDGATNISGGTLLVTGTHISSATSSANYNVNNTGTLGGTGTIDLSLANLNVTVNAGGKLSPGASGAGTLSLALGTGILNVSGAANLINTQALVFELGSVSDKITMTLGTLNIGTGVLEFDDFNFTALGGFGQGTYTLFDTTAAITGSLGSNLTGTIGGLDATLGFADGTNDLVLTVVPEPSTYAIVFGGFAMLLCLQRGMRRSRQACS